MNAPDSPPAFVVDHMVIRLGKYLRIAGFDAAWDLSVRTHELISRANAEDRIFLTRNRRIPGEYPAPRQLLSLDDDDPARQFAEVVRRLNLDPQARLFTRCIRCNVDLLSVTDRESVRARVHPNVFARYARFYRCPHCATVFWHGSHVRNTCRKLRLAMPDTAGGGIERTMDAGGGSGGGDGVGGSGGGG